MVFRYLGMQVLTSPEHQVDPSSPMSGDTKESLDLHTQHEDLVQDSSNFNGTTYQRGRRAPRGHLDGLHELRAKVAAHDETIERLKAAFGALVLSLGPSLHNGSVPPTTHGSYRGGYAGRSDHVTDDHTTASHGGRWLHGETPANRPPRGGVNGNTSHYKTNNRGYRGPRSA